MTEKEALRETIIDLAAALCDAANRYGLRYISCFANSSVYLGTHNNSDGPYSSFKEGALAAFKAMEDADQEAALLETLY